MPINNRGSSTAAVCNIKTEGFLVVDDDTVILASLKEGLSLKGYHCQTAIDAAMALDPIDKQYFHTVVIDIILPDMNGFALTEKVKKNNPDITVITMTGSIHEFSYEDAMQAGASDFIKKPFSVKELIARIEHAKKHETLYRISLHDELTDLYNRRGFFTLGEQKLKIAHRMKKEMLLLFADVDHLKWITIWAIRKVTWP